MAYNYGSRILNNAVSALHTQQAVIATTGNNIANVDTEGYTRRVVRITNRNEDNSAALRIGNGVEVGEVQRYSDEFIEGKLRDTLAAKERGAVEDEFVSKIESLFDLTGDTQTIGNSLTAFYSAIDNLSVNPSSIELRTNLIESANTLISSIKSTYGALASIQDELDARISNELDTVNSIVKSIADLNNRISSIERSGLNKAYDERDQRDVLLLDLAEKIDYDLVENQDGTVTVSLSNGFYLVHSNNYHELSFDANPSFLKGAAPAESLSGGNLHYITYDYSYGNGTGDINLTNIIANQGGSIAGMLAIRGVQSPADDSPFDAYGTVVEVASRVEAITRELLTTFNTVYRGPDPKNGKYSVDLNGLPPDVFGFFTFDGAKDINGDGIATDYDLDNNAEDIKSFSRYLTNAINRTPNIAAGFAGDPNGGGTYKFAPGDSRNLEAVSNLKNDKTINFRIQNGNASVNFTGTFEEAYHEMVNFVGNARARSMVQKSVTEDKYISTLNQHDQVSAVSLDEEYTRLITAQQSYQASAKMIRVAQELFDEIIQMYH